MYIRKGYPKLIVDLNKLRHNTETVVSQCRTMGIQVTGVVKGCSGLIPCARAFSEAGVSALASSRLEQLVRIHESGIRTPLQLIRIPMLSEVADVVRYTDSSLNSELEVLRALNREALAQGKVHKVILMADCGDLREGCFSREELCAAALEVEREMKGLYLWGTGVNLGCYGSIQATPEKLMELVERTEEVECTIGRKVDVISGGSSTSYFRVLDGSIPERINMLRIGEAILTPAFMFREFGLPLKDMYSDVFTLQAEVIEVKNKPSYPVGEIGFDAFGHRPEYADRGIRRRALLGIGKCDYGDERELCTAEVGMEILGASSDHTILDVQEAEDAGRLVKVGDVLDLRLNYASLVYVSASENVHVEYV